MGWRRNEANTRRGVAYPTNPFIHLMTRQLSALAGLRTLGHFDLKFTGITEIVAGHAEAAGSNLLNGGIFPISIFLAEKTNFVLTTFTAIALASDPVHGNRQRAVRLV